MTNLASTSAAFPMGWHLAARAPEEVAAARDGWESGRRFGEFTDDDGDRLLAPPLGRRARS